MNKGSVLGEHDSAEQRMVNCHMASSRIARRCVAITSRVGERCCRRLWLKKFQFSYGKSFCFLHVVSPHPHGPPWWGSSESCKVIGEAGRQAERQRGEATRCQGWERDGDGGRSTHPERCCCTYSSWSGIPGGKAGAEP